MPNLPNSKILTPDQKTVVSKSIKDTKLAIVSLLQLVLKDELDVGYAKTLLSLIEMNMADTSKKLGVPTETQAEVEERFKHIQVANNRIRELERQLADSSHIDLAIQLNKLLEEKFDYWWRISGFGHTSEFVIKRYGVEAILSGSLFGNHANLFSETPVSDKENRALWIKSLIDQGYVLVGSEEPGQREARLVDCDKNRELITGLITHQFPSAHIMSITNFHERNQGFIIREIKVLIRDLHDIDRLPSPPVNE